eukprot:gb/GFBE01032255.1/.p1 GENE.gb/GFBE01032255.1/~~gb/GFBE01032255.1/.p1  ORF type:complete len:411 (+),score=100.11 gb/GFBE01032255.1/:1-1233(+)
MVPARALAIAVCLLFFASAAPENDFKSLFNKAFMDQLGASLQENAKDSGLPPLVVAEEPASGTQAKSREGQLDMQLSGLPQGMVMGGSPSGDFVIEFSSDKAEGLDKMHKQMLKDLFPGPLQFEVRTDSDDSGLGPFDAPDPLVMDMLSGVNTMMQDVMAPAIHKLDPVSYAPSSCQKDLAAHCAKARSQVHCLGRHSGDVSDNCRKDVGKSVPYLCSAEIDKHCDILQVGILDCLSKYESQLGDDCGDAVRTTSKVIAKLNSAKQQAPASASTKAPHAAAERERNLDSKFAAVLTTKGPSLVSAIKKAEQEAEAKLDADASKITALLSQMSNEMEKHGASRPQEHWLHENWRVVFGVLVLLVAAFFAFKANLVGTVLSQLKLMQLDGKPLLPQRGTELSHPFDDGDVKL